MRKPWELVQYFKTLPRNSGIRKAILMEEADAGNVPLFEGFNLAFNVSVVFGIKSNALPMKYKDGPGLTHEVFMESAHYILNNTRLAARYKELEKIAKLATMEEWDYWYLPILLKRLRCGVQVYVINKVIQDKYPQFCTNTFKCHFVYNKAVDLDYYFSEPCIVEPDVFGNRCITTVYPSGRVEMESVRGLDIMTKCPHIFTQFERASGQFGEPIVFDGELKSLRVHGRIDGRRSDPTITYYVYDIIPLKYFEEGKYAVPLIQRKQLLQSWFDRNPNLNQIKPVPFTPLDLSDAGDRARLDTVASDYVTDYCNNVIVKKANSAYECRVPMTWIKYRHKNTHIQMEITSIEVLDDDMSQLKCIRCKGSYRGSTIKAKVDRGFTEQQKREFPLNWSKLIGQRVIINAVNITENILDNSYTMNDGSFVKFAE